MYITWCIFLKNLNHSVSKYFLCPILSSLSGSRFTYVCVCVCVCIWFDIAPQLPKKCNAQERSNYHALGLISHASKVMLKILQAGLQCYMNWEFSDIQAGFWKGRGTKGKNANICWIIEKAREFQKKIYFCLTEYAKALTVCGTQQTGKFFKR